MSSRPWRVRGVGLAAAALAAAGLLAACGSNNSSGSSSSSGPSGLVTGSFGSGAPFVANFNPFSPAATDPTFGMIYEPLMFFDTAKAGVVEPWLATSYAWSNGGRSITFQLRHGVKWSDGKPFTSADVAYNFELRKSSPALNGYGLPIAGATTSGPYTVTINFSQPVYSDLYLIAGKSYIVPEHVWKNITNPATNLDSKPVGTGAYQVASVSPQVMELTANPHYYLPGLPKIKTYRFLTYSGNNTMDTAVENGQLGWSGAFIANINKTYLAKDAKYALVDLPLAVDFLIPNMEKGPQAALPVRQAISDAIDRSYISQAVYNGYAPPTDPEGLLVPNFTNIASPAALSDKFGGADPAAAKKALQAAGYKLGSNGMFSTPSGQPLSVNIKVVTGYTDYISILQIMQSELEGGRHRHDLHPGGLLGLGRGPGQWQLPVPDQQRRVHADPLLLLLQPAGQRRHQAARPGHRRHRRLRPLHQRDREFAADQDRGNDRHLGAERRVRPDRERHERPAARYPADGGPGRDRVQRPHGDRVSDQGGPVRRGRDLAVPG